MAGGAAAYCALCPGQGESLILEPPHSRAVRHSRARAATNPVNVSCTPHLSILLLGGFALGWLSVSMMMQAPLDKKQRKALYDSIEHGLGVRAICSWQRSLLCLT